MQILRFNAGEGARSGVLIGGEIAPLDLPPQLESAPAGALSLPPDGLRQLARRAEARAERIPLDRDIVLAPVPAPSKVIAIGLNYADHIAESKMETPEVPTVFAKFPSSVNGPYSDIYRPRVSVDIDYEGELGIVIGVPCRHVPVERAMEVIAGFVVFNDVSVRDWQLRSQQWTLGKSFDTHSPFGPWITTADEVDPSGLRLETFVNGERRQSSTTDNLVFDCAALVAHLSEACTLMPGDVIATGTPSGVGGAFDPPRYLVPGDTVKVEIEGLGAIENTLVDEPDAGAHIGGEGL